MESISEITVFIFRIDATSLEHMDRFINDSKKYANCRMKRVMDGKRIRVFIVATKNIRKGCELRYDYAPFNGKKELYWRAEVIIDIFEKYIRFYSYVDL